MTSPRRGPVRSDEGFTLLEMLVAVTILGIMATVLGAATTTSLKITAGTAESLIGTASRTVLAGRLLEDIRDSTSMGTIAAGPDCAGPPGSRPGPVLWTTNGTGASSVTVGYYVTIGTGTAPNLLDRVICGGATTHVAEWRDHSAVPHVFCDGQVEAVGCGLQEATLGSPLSATADHLDPSALFGIAGLPSSGTYQVYVDDESMTVTVADSGRLDLARGIPTDHSTQPRLRFSPKIVHLTIPTDPVGDSGLSYGLTIARRLS